MAYRNRLVTTISAVAAAGLGAFTVGPAQSGYATFSAGDSGLTFDVSVVEGTAWEVRTGCVYAHSGTTLSRGTLESSSTGSAIAFTAAAVLTVTMAASTGDAIKALVSGDRNLIGLPQIPVGTFGDSIALVSTYGNQDLRRISAGAANSSPERMGVAMIGASGGMIRMVFNGGISGQNTTEMLGRDALGGSSTRRALADAAASGVRFIVFSAGVNDFQNTALPAGSSEAVIASTVAATVTRVKALLRRAVSLGMYPIFPALLGYRLEMVNNGSLPTNNAAAVATTQAAIKLFNAAIKTEIEAADGALGDYIDSFLPSIVDSNGAWLPGMDQGDGLHPGMAGANAIYGPVAELIQTRAGQLGKSPVAFPDPTAVNQFTNADFRTVSSGVASGFNPYINAGTATLANSVVEWRGQLWQQVIVTPSALDGNGNVMLQVDITYTTPTAGDVIGGELSIYIDNGSGGAPSNVFQHAFRVRSGANYAETPTAFATISPKVGALAPIDRRYAAFPIVAAATPTPATENVIVFANALVPFRVMMARPRVVKLPATY